MIPPRTVTGTPQDRTQRVRLRLVVEALGVWLGLTVLLFFLYEAVDALWLGELPADRQEAAYAMRGLAMSLTATVVTAVYVLWRRMPSLQHSLVADDATRTETSAREPLARWLLRMRWVAALAVAAILLASTLGTRSVTDAAVPRLWAGLAVLVAMNTVLSLLPAQHRSSARALVGQILGDGLLLGWMLHHAGGMDNPFASLFVFQTVIAGIVLEPAIARRTAIAVGAVVLVLTGLEASGVLPPGCLLAGTQECVPTPGAHLAASGVAVAVLSVGCAFFVLALVRVLQRERDRVAAARGMLAEEREKLQSIIDCMADAVIFVNPQGTIQLRNRAADSLWQGGPPPDSDLKVCHSPETWAMLYEKVTNPGPFELHPVLEVGPRAFEATYARVEGDGGDSRGVVMVARDVTDRQKAQAWRMHQERMAVVGKLAAGLAHEINNPLGAIALFTQHALKKIPPGDPLAEHLGTVLRNANQCSKIVRDLLTYARQRPPEREDVDPAALIGDVARTIGPEAQHRAVTVELDVQTERNLSCDPDQVRQILVNLCLNAVEAMQDGGRLTLGVRLEPRATCFRVTDTGPGIPEPEREAVFTAFHTTKEEGTGLGLAVAQDLASAHGGRIDLECPAEGGCVFSVRIPFGGVVPAEEAAQ